MKHNLQSVELFACYQCP